MADRAIVLGLVEDLDRGAADVLVLVADQLQHGFDHLRAADLAERIGGAAERTHQSSSDTASSSSLTDLALPTSLSTSTAARRAYSFSSLRTGMRYLMVSGSLARITDVDGLVLHVDFRIAQQVAEQLHVEGAVHAGQRRQRGGAHQLVGVLELLLQRALTPRASGSATGC